MKRGLALLLATALLLAVTACKQEELMPDPNEDYTAYYEYLQQRQSEGKMPYEDKLVAKGEVTAPFSIIIGGKIFDNETASALTVYTAEFETYTKVEPHLNSWVGYRFSEVCELLELEPGDTIKLCATDGYSQAFDLKNTDGNTMIAITKDGDHTDGPYFAPCTYLISANYTKYLSEILLL